VACVKAVKEVGVPLVEIRPNYLCSNLYGMRDYLIQTGVAYTGYNAEAQCVMTHPTDVAQLAACLLVAPSDELAEHVKKGHYTVTGPKPFSMNELCGLLSNAIKAEEEKGQMRVAYQENLMQTFAVLDTNADGKASKKELTTALMKEGYSERQAKMILEGVPEEGLSPEAFVDTMSYHFGSHKPRAIAVSMDNEAFTAFGRRAGIDQESIDLLLSYYKCINEGWAGERAVDTADFQRIVGRMPYSPEDWVRENVGAFMASHWDVAQTHARAGQLVKAKP